MVSSQSVQAKFRFRAGYDAVGAKYASYRITINTENYISVSSDGQRQFDII